MWCISFEVQNLSDEFIQYSDVCQSFYLSNVQDGLKDILRHWVFQQEVKIEKNFNVSWRKVGLLLVDLHPSSMHAYTSSICDVKVAWLDFQSLRLKMESSWARAKKKLKVKITLRYHFCIILLICKNIVCMSVRVSFL